MAGTRHAGLRGRLGRAALVAALAAAGWSLPGEAAGGVTVQFFEARWQTIERRMPDVFMAGYGAMWLPPAARADSSNFSVGFDVFDRFDLGNEGNPTLYGTEVSFDFLMAGAKRAGMLVYFDTVYNHNGFSDGYRGDVGVPPASACQLNWAIGQGGYPGFVMSGRDLSLPFNLEFRCICPSSLCPVPSCDSDPQNCRIAGLIDINHDTNYQWIRHPASAAPPSDPGANVPYQQWNPTNRRFYPDQDLASPYPRDGVKPFNLNNPQAGDPGKENVNQMLQRYTQYMLEVKGVQGFRLDAVKHMPAGWFTNIFDFATRFRARDFWGRQKTPFSFGEFVDASWSNLEPYHRSLVGSGTDEGLGNRTLIDFPLFFAIKNNVGNPSGNLAAVLDASFDGSDGNAQDGSRGVQFASSHDTGFIGDPVGLDNVAYAVILSRKGAPIVYYNAQEFGTGRPFPNTRSRGDAFGRFGSIITSLVNINNNHVNRISGNPYVNLWRDNDSIVFEQQNTLIAAISDFDGQGPNNQGYITRTLAVTPNGFRGITLKEMTGNAQDITVDPIDNIKDTITIPGTVGAFYDINIPTTVNRNGVRHDKPYVMYTIEPPQGTMTVLNTSGTIPADGPSVPTAVARITPIDIVTGNTAQVRLAITGGSIEDNALIKWNYGLNVDGDASGSFGCALGVDDPILAGFDNFTTKSPRFGGGTGQYAIDVNLSDGNVPEGMNYITAVAFVQRSGSLPPIFNTFRKVIYVDRVPPNGALVFPANPTGTNDIQSSAYGFVFDNPDGTANAVHFLLNLSPTVTDPVAAGLVNDSNKATQSDRNRYRYTLTNLSQGTNQRLTVVAFEESGRYSVFEYSIGVNLGAPSRGGILVR